jgi:putative ABC transport system permease protein
LGATAVLGAWAGRIGSAKDIGVAIVRAVAQLGLVSTVLALVLASSGLTAGYVLIMLAVAAFASARRVGPQRRASAWTVLPIAGGALPALGVTLATGAIPLTNISVLPIAGILIGGAMTATSLCGRQARTALTTRWGEFEAGLALGLSVREATLELLRPSVGLALVPAIDPHRRSGDAARRLRRCAPRGGTAVQAGAAQVLVLVGILAAQVVATVITTEQLARTPDLLGPLR